MTVIARRIPSVPRRTPGETWSILCDLIAPSGSAARQELDSASSIASMLIAEEYLASSPAILSGGGPQLRFYTLHGDDAIEEEDPTPLSFDPTHGEWRLSLPTTGSDFELAREALSGSTHVTVHDIEETKAAARESNPRSGERVIIDLERLVR